MSKILESNKNKFFKEFNAIYSDFEIISEYKGARNNITIKCIKCGKEYTCIAGNLINRKRKPKYCICSGGRRKLTKSEYEQTLQYMSHNKVILIGKYVDLCTKTTHKCNICGYIWDCDPRHLIDKHHNSGCPKCSGNLKLTHHDYIDLVINVNSNIKVIEQYNGYNNAIKHQCLKCNHSWNATPHNILKGTSCPKCNASHGENKIEKYLKNNNIEYFSQYKFDNCVDKRSLPFDFYIPNKNICIEYDGIQHFQPIKIFGDDNGFLNTQRRDKIKSEYCNVNNIKLIRIPYYDYDKIEEILSRELEVV